MTDAALPPPLPADAGEAGPSRWQRLLAWQDRQANRYRLTRFILLRFTGLVYFVAFLSAAQQFLPLIGHRGLLPADLWVERAVQGYGSRWQAFFAAPSLFWFWCDDSAIQWVMWGGTVLAAIVLCGYANSLIMLVLWALYLSLIPIGQEWLGYGWDIQILETGFLGVMLCPLLDPRPFPRRAPPLLIIWLYRWLIFRIMLGAGLIKIRGDDCWRDLTALYYHYETQPIPNPLSRWLHFAPHWFQKFGVAWNHLIELIVPWFCFYGRWSRHIAGVLMTSFMVILIFSGNLSFLNWLTIIPCLACFDDSFWQRVLPRFLVTRALASATDAPKPSLVQSIATIIYAGVVAVLSIGPVSNLLSKSQVMNTSFDTLHLVNTYGAFGSIDKERIELVFEGTENLTPGWLADWRAYDFKAKPTDPMQRPVIITPYHYRLDWAAWFPWHRGNGYKKWLIHFQWNLLHNDAGTLSLLAGNPFPAAPPKWVRITAYRYHFAPPGNNDGAWWTREKLGDFMQPVSIDQLAPIIRDEGWLRD